MLVLAFYVELGGHIQLEENSWPKIVGALVLLFFNTLKECTVRLSCMYSQWSYSSLALQTEGIRLGLW